MHSKQLETGSIMEVTTHVRERVFQVLYDNRVSINKFGSTVTDFCITVSRKDIARTGDIVL